MYILYIYIYYTHYIFQVPGCDTSVYFGDSSDGSIYTGVCSTYAHTWYQVLVYQLVVVRFSNAKEPVPSDDQYTR